MHSKEIKVLDLIIYLAVVVEFVSMILGYSTIPYGPFGDELNLAIKGLRLLGYGLAVCRILLDRFKINEIFLIVIIAGIVLINSLFAGSSALLSFIMILALKDTDLDKIFKIATVTMLICVLFVVFAAFSGLIDNWNYSRAGSDSRLAMGFFYPSHATSAFFYLGLAIIYVLKDNKKYIWLFLPVMIAVNIIQYYFTGSRAGMLLIYLYVAVFFIETFRTKFNLIDKIKVFIFPICAVMSCIVAFIYDGTGILCKINSMLSNRILLAHRALVQYGVRLIGRKITWVGYGGNGFAGEGVTNNYNFVDCAYVKLLLDNGIIVFGLIIILYTRVCYHAYKTGNRILLNGLFFTALYCMFETKLFVIGYNPFVLLMGMIFSVDFTKFRFKIKLNH